MGDTCGAVTGALMVIGLKYGQTTGEDKAAKEKSYELVREFVKRFRARNRGCIACRELLGADISTPDGMQKIREKQAFTTMCPKFVRDAAEIVEELL
jgi:C_GCAxxG_C_C family probable redox protein